MNIRFGKYCIDVHLRARRAWNSYTIGKASDSSARWFCWWRLWVCIEDMTIEVYPICGLCDADEIKTVSAGDESWSICGSCRAIEQDVRYVNKLELKQLGRG